MLAKLERYGRKTNLSQKQYQTLMELTGSAENQGPPAKVLKFPKSRRAKAAYEGYRKRKSFLPWRSFRLFGIRLPVAAFLIALLVVLLVAERNRVAGFLTSFTGNSPIVLRPEASGNWRSLNEENSTGSWRTLNEENSTSPNARSSTDSLKSRHITVVDGDTIRVRGQSASIRLVGFNTPETYNPVCEAGLALGKQATARLKELIRNASSIELEIVPCACRPGTQGTEDCNYGRQCGKLSVDGRDVGRTLISEGLAAPFRCGTTACPPTPRPWCK
ncbi:hypothetical protein GV827_22480 [Sulfitobacter sp. JBTF-M27]|uniref:TNase-like domain-containing protein n=2 Tax=Sulfitobacter sediminilitoris TaxID=2698830 RepID=A0A6P0CJA6_9RHOB|nr:hypothetical protein [Sulfitobacter sediminilitoris]